jgi:hypothetical protein
VSASGNHTSAQPGDDPRAALERLAAALGSAEFVITMTIGPGRPPHLTVTRKHAGFGVEIYADNQAYWWSFAERIAAVDDPQAAARKVISALHTTPEASHG